ncbi:RNA polymerase sigma factor SigW [Ferviditalea candida]|uniref:RNA polymerase sigma factor n=1 Tax=Ferviditalea candida TaxID=3108399 RepID=A0ABU5ZQE3_9BACL|nr:RNA polymerase sigma factor SigW [Paenibacillaceae bacterium T2]
MRDIEARLAKLAYNGDRNAFSELVDLYTDKIFHLANRMLGNRQEAEDIVQETFLRVYKNLGKYDPNQKFSTWIYRIATNLCIDRLRRRKHQYSLDAEVADGEGIDWHAMLASDEPGPEQRLILSEIQLQMRKAIEALPEKYKSVVILRYLHDLSLQEISEILDIPVTTIKTRVHRGREFLRRKLEQDKLLL